MFPVTTLIIYSTSRLPGFAREEGWEGRTGGREGGRERGWEEGGWEGGKGGKDGEGGIEVRREWRGMKGGREGRERGWSEGPERSRQSDCQHYVISRHRTSSGSF